MYSKLITQNLASKKFVVENNQEGALQLNLFPENEFEKRLVLTLDKKTGLYLDLDYEGPGHPSKYLPNTPRCIVESGYAGTYEEQKKRGIELFQLMKLTHPNIGYSCFDDEGNLILTEEPTEVQQHDMKIYHQLSGMGIQRKYLKPKR